MKNMNALQSNMIPREREPEEEDFETHFYQAVAMPVRRWGMGSLSGFPTRKPETTLSQPGNPS
jgi:hypothetical protein